MSRKTAESPIVKVILPANQREQLRKLAKEENRSVSGLLRHLAVKAIIARGERLTA